jgi:hypothetical protein
MEDTVDQVDIADLQRAQLTSACAGDGDQPQVQRQYRVRLLNQMFYLVGRQGVEP